MSSESDSDNLMDFDVDQVMAAKRDNPGMFVSAWEADENDIDSWSKAEIRKDPAKKLVVAAEEGDLDTVMSIVNGTRTKSDGDKAVKDILSFKDQDGYTALHRAAYGGHTHVIQYLIECGSNVNNLTMDGWTPLHSAAFWNQLASVQMLINAGADINAVTNANQTALHLAVSNNQSPETLLFLLAQPGIRVCDIKNKQGETAADLIRRNTPYSQLCYAFSEPVTCLKPKP